MNKEEIRALVNDEMKNKNLSLTKAVYAINERLIEELKDKEKLACGKKCSLCCHQQPACTAIEWKEVEDFVDEHKLRPMVESRNVETFIEWQQYRADNWMAIMQDHYKPFRDWLGRKPCIFLNKNGACDVYEARPMLCRTFTSTVKCVNHEQPEAMNFRYDFQVPLIEILLETGHSMTYIDQFLGNTK